MPIRRKFLLILAHDYGLPREAAMAIVERWRGSKEPPRALARALEPPAVRLLREFVGLPQGVKFVVDLRAELLTLGKSDAAARALSEDLRPLLSAWFDVGFLDLVRIDWKASAALTPSATITPSRSSASTKTERRGAAERRLEPSAPRESSSLSTTDRQRYLSAECITCVSVRTE